MTESTPITIFGEVLFDCFPDGEKVLGGAPFNVAWNLRALGQNPRFVSRLGQDAEGTEVRQAMADWGMDASAVQSDTEHGTGVVSVSLEDGEPSYDIVSDRAYDHIDAAALPDAPPGLLYHGTLALRQPASRAALDRLRSQTGAVFVDVNLRAPWWQREETLALVQGASWVKLNGDELRDLGDGTEDDSAANRFRERYGLELLIVTHGARGAIAYRSGSPPLSVTPTSTGTAVDPVGAGDAFASVILLGLTRQWPLETTLKRAQDFAAAVVGLRGATSSDAAFYGRFTDAWERP